MLDTYYGSYRTRTFAQIFPSLEEFNKMYDEIEKADPDIFNLCFDFFASCTYLFFRVNFTCFKK